MLHYKRKRKVLHIPTVGVYAVTRTQAVSEEINVSGNIYPDFFLIQHPKSRLAKKAKFAIKSIETFHKKGGNIGVVLADATKGERKRNHKNYQYVFECPFHSIHEFVKTISVLKKCWYVQTLNSDGFSILALIRWGHHFTPI